MGGIRRTHGEVRNAYICFVGKPEWKRPFERPRHRREDNIIMDLKEIGAGYGLCLSGSG
jgi:hypothetical protein